MARGEYRSFVGAGAELPQKTEPPSQIAPSAPDTGRGQYAPRRERPSWRLERPWTEGEHQAFQRSAGLSAIGAVAGAVLWKSHRVWGFILGGMAGGGVGNLIFAPPSGLPLYER